MNFVWHGRVATFESLPCQSRVARQSLSNFIALPNLILSLIQTPYFCRAFVELKQEVPV